MKKTSLSYKATLSEWERIIDETEGGNAYAYMKMLDRLTVEQPMELGMSEVQMKMQIDTEQSEYDQFMEVSLHFYREKIDYMYFYYTLQHLHQKLYSDTDLYFVLLSSLFY